MTCDAMCSWCVSIAGRGLSESRAKTINVQSLSTRNSVLFTVVVFMPK